MYEFGKNVRKNFFSTPLFWIFKCRVMRALAVLFQNTVAPLKTLRKIIKRKKSSGLDFLLFMVESFEVSDFSLFEELRRLLGTRSVLHIAL